MKYSILIFIALLSLALNKSANAQLSPFNFINYPGATAEETLKQIDTRIKELNSQSVPKNDLALTRELDSLDTEITSSTSDLQRLRYVTEIRKRYDAAIGAIQAARTAIISVDCTDISSSRKHITAYFNALGQLDEFRQYTGDLSALRILLTGVNEQASCDGAKTELGSKEFEDKFQQLLSLATSSISKAVTESESLIAASTRLIEALRAYRSKLRDALNNGTPQQKITADLPLILGILGGACVLAIVGVKLFDEEIQMEWVASGQVIQFVTVMVLLSVIAALGLSDVLKENTLGTLLGGIAGYVLAQGVGRAAARDASRTLRTQAKPKPDTPADKP